METSTKNLKQSTTPRSDILTLSYPGQPESRRLYKPGYESFFESLPVLDDHDPNLGIHVEHSKRIMQALALKLSMEPWLKGENVPGDNEFVRTILGIESPIMDGEKVVKEGSEIVLAKWGHGLTSMVHGHAAGYLHEEIIFGKMKVNTYRMLEPNSKKVRLIGTDIAHKGTFASLYTKENKNNFFKRQALIHNFQSIGLSATLHYLPEHTRDGRDNRFDVEYFDDYFQSLHSNVQRVTTREAMYAQKGDVLLIRSSNVPEYGDHYIYITGHPILKPHGLRPQEIAYDAPKNTVLNEYGDDKFVALKLNDDARKAFVEFHGINEQVTNN